MICFRSSLVLLLRYCVIDVVSLHALGNDCLVADGSEPKPVAHSLLQRQSTQAQAVREAKIVAVTKTQSEVVRKPWPMRDSVVQSGISLVSQKSDKVAASNESSAKSAINNPHLPGEGSDRVHHSIFELSFAQLDRSTFWILFACMLVFTIVVDQVETFAKEKSETSPTNRQFLDRVNMELVMFGCVGLFMFGVKNIKDLPEEQDILVEFVDILCSMGACGLIAIAAVLFAVRRYSDRRWKGFEAENLLGSPIQPTGPLESCSFIDKYLVPRPMESMDYQIMAKRFRQRENLPDDFMYSEYLNHTLCTVACDLMAIKPMSWFAMLILVLLGFLVRTLHGSAYDNIVYVRAFLIANWLMLICFCLLLARVNFKHSELVQLIRKDEQKLQAAGVKMGAEFERHPNCNLRPEVGDWSQSIRWSMQLITLFNSFLGSFYILHLQYNLHAASYHWAWRPLLLFPLFVSLFIMLPVITFTFTMTEAYVSPDSDSLDATVQQLHQLEEDFEYIRKMWILKGKPQFPTGAEGVDAAGLGLVLRGLGMSAIGKARLYRVFFALDADYSGTVTSDELMMRLDT